MSEKNKCTLPYNQDGTNQSPARIKGLRSFRPMVISLQAKVGSLINQGHFAPCYKSNVYVLTRLYLPN